MEVLSGSLGYLVRGPEIGYVKDTTYTARTALRLTPTTPACPSHFAIAHFNHPALKQFLVTTEALLKNEVSEKVRRTFASLCAAPKYSIGSGNVESHTI